LTVGTHHEQTIPGNFYRGYDPSVRVPEIMLKCVGFVGEVAHTDPVTHEAYGDLHGTGFFVCIRPQSPRLRKNTSARFVFFVTAKHLIEGLKDKPVYFRVNKVGGGTTTLRTQYGNQWWLHPTDKTADVAIVPIGFQADADIRAVEFESLGTPEVLNKLTVGIGDEVYAIGLFQPPGGADHNVPIVRHGNIAMMPEEQIQTELGFADVYLVEARSIGGLSGSPVFVRPTINLPIPDNQTGLNHAFCQGHGTTLLGLMHGHWSIKESELNSPVINQDAKHGVNLGVGIVVPALKIYETLERMELRVIRQKAEDRMVQQGVPGMDSTKQKDEPEKELFTKEEFETALKKVSRKKT
jgi:hypothetical protein